MPSAETNREILGFSTISKRGSIGGSNRIEVEATHFFEAERNLNNVCGAHNEGMTTR